MEFKVTAKSVYGETKFYPANDAAQALADIAGTKTLTYQTLKIASRLGTVVADGDATLKALFNTTALMA